MDSLQAILDAFMRVFTMRLDVFGFPMTFLSLLIGLSLVSIAIYAVFKFYN